MAWDPGQYGKFRDERARPFFDLLARVPQRPFGRIADLGCGTGRLTRLLAERWPLSRIIGIDASLPMLSRAEAIPGRLEFHQGDIATWAPEEPFDLVVSNAALHWIPDQAALLPRLITALTPGGVLAVQVPGNQGAPSHQEVLRLASESPWKELLAGRWTPHAVDSLPVTVERLLQAGLAVEAWETTYLHVLPGPDPVLEWLKGTTLRSILELLGPEGARFTDALAPRLRVAYPPSPAGTLFPFRRLFWVAAMNSTVEFIA